MSDPIPLQMCRLAVAVSWDGPSSTTLSTKHGTLTYLPDEEVVLAIPFDAKKIEQLIPRDNVVTMQPLHSMRGMSATDTTPQPQQALGSMPPVAPVAPAVEEAPVEDTISYVKDPKTGAVVEVKGKAKK